MRKHTGQPLRMHKRLIVLTLEAHPEALADIFPDGPYNTAAEAIQALREHPATWFVGGTLDENDPRCMEVATPAP